jgi:signal transduction histidine kinase
LASIAEHRLHSRNGVDMAASIIAVLLGFGGILGFYYGYTRFFAVALPAAMVMLIAALVIGVQGYRRHKAESNDTGVMMHAIAEALPHPVIVRNVDGDVIFSNAAARPLLQWLDASPSEPPDLPSCLTMPAMSAAQSGTASSGPAAPVMRRQPWRSSKGQLLGWVEMPAGAEGDLSPTPLVSEQDLENLVTQRTAEVRDLVAHIESCREEEKKAIARKLHGELGSSLTALSMHLAILSRQVPDQPAVHARLQQMKELLSAAHGTTRRIQSGLRPDKLDLFGMRAAVEDLADSLSQSTGIACTLHFSENVRTYPAPLEITLYRMLEEALRNVTQHAYATQVDISFEEQDDCLTVSICDNGVGFSLHDLPANANGLRSLREKAAYLGGRVVIQSAPGEGSRLSFILPASRQAEPAATGEPNAG